MSRTGRTAGAPPQIPILAYHAVEEGPGPLCLPPAVVARQLDALLEAGCVALTVSEVADHIAVGRQLPTRSVALTFDDGYRSVHETALPLLAERGLRATVYPVTAELGGFNRWDTGRPGVPRLALASGGQLRELAAAGWEVGGHTHTHPELTGLPVERIQEELTTSQAILECLLGQPVRSFAYPFGAHDHASRALAGQRYRTALTIGAERASTTGSLDALPRVDAWYLQRWWQCRHIHGPVGSLYLAARRCARRVRARGRR